MARHVWTVLCRSASIDAETKALSLFEVVNEIEILGEQAEHEKVMAGPGFAVVPVEMTLVSLWRASSTDETISVRVRVKIPGRDEPMTGMRGRTAFERDGQYARMVVPLPSIPLSTAGTYEFVIEQRPAPGESDDPDEDAAIAADQEKPWTFAATVPLEIDLRLLDHEPTPADIG